MPTQGSLFDLVGAPLRKREQLEYFQAPALTETFQSRIALTQAAGKDGIRGGRFSQIIEKEVSLIEKKILDGSYHFTTYKERLISRGYDRNPRQISIPTIRDRLVLRAICELIHTNVSGSVNFTPHSIVNNVVKSLRKCSGDFSFVRVDVKDFYPSIRHDILSRELSIAGLEPFVVDLCMKASCTPTGSSKKSVERGIPQGLSISNAMAQIYMRRFDLKQNKDTNNYFRYVDDILCITPTFEANSSLKRITSALNRRGLRAHPVGKAGKTEITSIGDGIDFLGYRIDVERISIRKSSYDKMFKRILEVITDYKYTKDLNKLIYRINIRITGCIFGDKKRGWMFFFSRTENLSQLKSLDAFVIKSMRGLGVNEEAILSIKKFVKSYYEIRFNVNDSKYIPNFNEFSIGEKINAIASLTNHKAEIISTWTAQAIEEVFKRTIAKEVMDLEQDIGGIS